MREPLPLYAVLRPWGEHVDGGPICAGVLPIREETLRRLLGEIREHEAQVRSGKVQGFPQVSLEEGEPGVLRYYPLRRLHRRPFYKEYLSLRELPEGERVISEALLSHAEPIEAEAHRLRLSGGRVGMEAKQKAVGREMNTAGFSRPDLYRFLILHLPDARLEPWFSELVREAPEVVGEWLAGDLRYLAPGGWMERAAPRLGRERLAEILARGSAALRLQAMRQMGGAREVRFMGGRGR